jgi:hypothetical protein
MPDIIWHPPLSLPPALGSGAPHGADANAELRCQSAGALRRALRQLIFYPLALGSCRRPARRARIQAIFGALFVAAVLDPAERYPHNDAASRLLAHGARRPTILPTIPAAVRSGSSLRCA